MRAQVAAAGAPAAASLRAEHTHSPSHSSRPWRLDWFDGLALVLFGTISLWVLTLDLIQVIGHGQIWTGTDGVYIVDQMQYLAWIRDASHHVLISNLYVLRHTSPVYFQPAIALSGGLVALGVAPWIALLVWKPIAIAVAFFGVRWYVRASLDRRGQRRAALALALFFGAFSIVYGSPGVVGDLFLGFLSWGYTFGLLATGAMLLALVSYDRARATGSDAMAAGAALLGMLAGLLHPWQAELLIVIIVGAEAWSWRSTRSTRNLVFAAVVVAASAAPLLYYVALGALDQSWHLARIASKHSFPMGAIALALLPLVLIAAPAYVSRPRSFMDVATRMWPLAAIVIYFISTSGTSATPLHAFQGVSVPMAILAVQGGRRLGLPRLPKAGAVATALVAAVTVPSVYMELREAKILVKPTRGNANFISRDEQHALHYLAKNPDSGGVLTKFYLGAMVPEATGRRTYVGDCIWSEPGCNPRAEMAEWLFDGTLSDAQARAFILSTGARFVLADCHTSRNMDELLEDMSIDIEHFGCAAVYELAVATPPTGPLADSAPNAAFRAPGRQHRGVQSA
jgi:hypothetical protein